MKRLLDVSTTASFFLGLILFIYLVRQVRSENIYARVNALNSGFILIIGLSAIRPVIRSWAWLRAMTAEERQVGFLAVWRARLIGDAMGNLTMTGLLAAEPFRLKALCGMLPLMAGISSLTIESLTYAVSCCGMVLVGTLLLLSTFAVSESLLVASLIALNSILWIIVATAVVVIKRYSLLSGLAIRLNWAIKRLHLNIRLEQKIEYLARLEKHIFEFYAQRAVDFFLIVICEATFHLSGIMETYITLYLIGSKPTLQVAFIFEALNRVINIVFNFVPARLGVDEAGSGLFAQTLGLGTDVGVMLAIVRKARVLFWSALGLLLFACSALNNTQLKRESKNDSV